MGTLWFNSLAPARCRENQGTPKHSIKVSRDLGHEGDLAEGIAYTKVKFARIHVFFCQWPNIKIIIVWFSDLSAFQSTSNGIWQVCPLSPGIVLQYFTVSMQPCEQSREFILDRKITCAVLDLNCRFGIIYSSIDSMFNPWWVCECSSTSIKGMVQV